MLLTIQNNIEVFKTSKSSIHRFSAENINKKFINLSTRKSFHVSKLSSNKDNNDSNNRIMSSILPNRKFNDNLKLTSFQQQNSITIKNINDDLESINSLESLNSNEEKEIISQLNIVTPTPTPICSPRDQLSRSKSFSVHRTPSPTKQNDDSPKIKRKLRLIHSAPLKHQDIERRVSRSKSELTNIQSKNLNRQRKSTADKKKEFKLEELCIKPKYPRFIAYLSVDAQFAMMKAYEDTLREELYTLYPQVEIIPRTSSARFIGNNIKFEDHENENEIKLRPVEQFNISEEDKLKISHFIQSAMTILDKVIEIKQKNININYFKNSDEKSPLYMYIQWVKLWNKEFL